MVYVFLAEGFEEIEALTPVDLLRRAGVSVQTVGVGSKNIMGSHGICVCADITEEQLPKELPQAVILPGGMPGTLNLENSEAVQKMLAKCCENNVFIAAICAAPSILGHIGLLEDRNATAFPSFQKELLGAKLSKDYVCRDGNIITARGMGVSTQFGLKLVEILVSKEKSDEIMASIQVEI